MKRVRTIAIKANLEVFAEGLREAADLAASAHNAMHDGQQNLAIGTVLPLEGDLPVYAGLLTAILALHRRPDCPVTNESTTNG